MRIEVHPDAGRAGAAAAQLVAAAAAAEPTLTLGVATGSSPEPLYRALAEQVRAGLDLGRASAWALDEYVGLPAGHPQSYRSVVARTVTGPLGLDPDRVHVPDGAAADPHTAADAYETALVAAGGVDLQVLGIGHNGHLAFNEPGADPRSRTRVVPLTGGTRAANARFFGGDVTAVPTHAVTQGLGTIMRARTLLLVVAGEDKAPAVAAALAGPVDVQVPASLVQTHPRTVVVLDAAAASLLPRTVPADACAAAPRS